MPKQTFFKVIEIDSNVEKKKGKQNWLYSWKFP